MGIYPAVYDQASYRDKTILISKVLTQILNQGHLDAFGFLFNLKHVY